MSRVCLQDGDVRWPLPLEALVAVNLVIFLGWLLGSTRWMVKYFEVSARNLIRHPWTLLTASVSHADLYSLIGNFQVSIFPPRSPGNALPLKPVPAPWPAC